MCCKRLIGDSDKKCLLQVIMAFMLLILLEGQSCSIYTSSFERRKGAPGRRKHGMN